MKKISYIYWLFPVSQFLMIYGSYSVNKSMDFRGIVGIVLSLAADAIIFCLLWHAIGKEKVENQLNAVIITREAEAKKHASMEKSQEELIRIREELEKKFAEISENDSEIRNDKIDEFQKMLDDTRREKYTENAVINAIIAEKKNVCETELLTPMDIDVNIPAIVKVSAIHLCSLFSNLLDNAIDALADVEKSKRMLKLSAVTKDKFVIIKLENSATESHVKRKKRDNHGYGTKIIKNIAEINGGTYESKYNNGCYTTMVMLHI